MVDDISYTYGTPSYSIAGYNIYRDGIRINDAVLTENQYVDDLTGISSETGTYRYQVTAIYDEGESGLSNEYEANVSSGIEGPSAENISIQVEHRVIRVDGADDIAVYGIDGKIYGIGHDTAAIAVEPGIYVVKADGQVTRVCIR